ncbi:MAG: propanediol utilization protein, partial [Clostridia bacterium]|nr:propanediol utilization protein [Clostridia bacterium]
GSAAVKLVGPCGEVELAEGCIAAKRHIHLTPEDAKEYGLENGQIVSVVLNDTARPLIFGDVVVRVSEKFSAAMHIDTDESNAACASGTVYGEIFK